MSDLFGPDTKVGDAVCIKCSAGWRHYTLRHAQITKVTKTQVVAFDRRWSRRSGDEIGGTGGRWHRDYLLRATPEVLAEAAAMQDMIDAERACGSAADVLKRARGQEAVRIAALLPDELRKETRHER
jgi:hypothetical protein